MTSSRRPGLRLLAAFLPILLVAACADEPAAPGPLAAKGGGGGSPKVTATDPDSGQQGQRLNVRVLGSGYNPTAVATWERNGVPDPKVTVNSTTFISSSEVIADVSIAADADTVLYDVAVEITASDGSRKKGVGIEKFQVNGPSNGPEVPYYVTATGGLITNPTDDAPPIAQEQVVYAYAIQTATLSLTLRYNWPGAPRTYPSFVNTKANGASCKKGHHRITDQQAAALLDEVTSTDQTPHGFRLVVDSAGVAGEGSGEVGTHYMVSPGSPFYPDEIWVGVQYMSKTAPEYGYPKVTLESSSGTETVYRFHAGYGSVRVWWRGNGPGGSNTVIACRLMDDVYVKVRPGF